MTLIHVIAAFALISASLSAIMAGAWLVWRRTGNSGWVDTTWSFGLGAVGIAGALLPGLADGLSLRQAVIAALMGAWALRLGLHIASRSAGITDDPRYARLARDWGADAPRQMFILLQKQALVSIPLALSVFLAASNPVAFRLQDVLGVLVLAIAIAGEAIADAQLARFRARPENRDRICDTGLWGWSRHPNYFFHWLGWVAYPLLAIDLGGVYPWGWLALAGPACMYWLLVHVSGIPPLEAHMLERRGERFRAYQRRTSAFFPLPPRAATGGRA